MGNTTIENNRIGYKLNRGKGYWVSKNEDGTLLVSLDGKEKYENAGSLIGSLGGINKVLEMCEPEAITFDDYRKETELKARIARYGKELTDEQKQKNKSFYERLVAMQEELRKPHQNEKGLWVSARWIGSKHQPVRGNEGFRFEYPFHDIRFDSVYGWQQLGKYSGWSHIDETTQKIIRLRMHCGLPEYQPTSEERDVYNERREQLLVRMRYEEQTKQEITSAYEAIKDLRPVPATIENITAILHYYKMQESVGELLPMTIGYSCNDYDCDGKYAVAIKLDRPIVYNEDGDMSDRFVCGAPHGHLMNYKRI